MVCGGHVAGDELRQTLRRLVQMGFQFRAVGVDAIGGPGQADAHEQLAVRAENRRGHRACADHALRIGPRKAIAEDLFEFASQLPHAGDGVRRECAQAFGAQVLVATRPVHVGEEQLADRRGIELTAFSEGYGVADRIRALDLVDIHRDVGIGGKSAEERGFTSLLHQADEERPCQHGEFRFRGDTHGERQHARAQCVGALLVAL